ncbi:MAG: hypothetical protein R3C05_28735 [Pirellulaceae bacterium]
MAGLDGDDRFTVAGNHPFTSIAIDGGSPDSGSDVLTFSGGGAAVTANLSGSDVASIGEAGSAAVGILGVESVVINAGGAALSASLTNADDTFTYRPTAAAAVISTGRPYDQLHIRWGRRYVYTERFGGRGRPRSHRRDKQP